MRGVRRPRDGNSNLRRRLTSMPFAKFLTLPAILTAIFAAFGSEPASAENYLCRQQFALCTSAPCIPQPGSTKVAMCTCDVALMVLVVGTGSGAVV